MPQYAAPRLTQPIAGSGRCSGAMYADPILLELWILALAAIVNAAPARVHWNVCEAIALRGGCLHGLPS